MNTDKSKSMKAMKLKTNFKNPELGTALFPFYLSGFYPCLSVRIRGSNASVRRL
jgi:hypothetical protein